MKISVRKFTPQNLREGALYIRPIVSRMSVGRLRVGVVTNPNVQSTDRSAFEYSFRGKRFVKNYGHLGDADLVTQTNKRGEMEVLVQGYFFEDYLRQEARNHNRRMRRRNAKGNIIANPLKTRKPID